MAPRETKLMLLAALLAGGAPAACRPALSTASARPAASDCAPAGGAAAGVPGASGDAQEPEPPGPAPASASPAAPLASGQPAPGAASRAGTLASLSFEGGEATYAVAAGNEARPVAVFLHGMCASGKLECPVFAAASRSHWLLCADGPVRCDGGGWMWSATPKATEERLRAATEALRASEGGRVGAGPMAIVGYSLGAPAALLQAMREPGRYDRLMIVNASVEPSAAAMKSAGVRRVALVAGARDATAAKLSAAAKRLAGAGVEARFFALEATGHYFDGQSGARMAEPLGWLLGP